MPKRGIQAIVLEMKTLLILGLLIQTIVFAAPRKKLFSSKHRTPASYAGEAVTIEKITRIENLRIPHDPYLLSVLYHPSFKIVKAALLAIARIGDPYAIDDLQKLLNRKNPEVQKYAAFALGMIGNDVAVKILEQQIQFQKNTNVIAEVLVNIGRAGKEKSLKLLTKTLETSKDLTVLNGACEGTGFLFVNSNDKWMMSETLLPQMVQLTLATEPLALSCAFALARFKGDPSFLPSELILKNIDKVTSSGARAFLARTLGKTKKPEAYQWLMRASLKEKNLGVRVESIRALKGAPVTEELTKTFRQLLKDSNNHVVVTALETAAQMQGQLTLQESLEETLKNSKSFWVRRQSLLLMAKINFAQSKKIALELLKYPTSNLYGTALSILANGSSEDMDALIPLFEKTPPKPLSELFDTLTSLPSEKFSYVFKQGLKKTIGRNEAGLTAQIAQLAEQFKWREFGEDLAHAYKNFSSNDLVEVKVSILNALNAFEEKSLAPYIEPALNDPEKSVVVAAVQTIKTLTGRDESARIPLNSKVTAEVPSLSQLQAAVNTTIVLKTSKGEIHLRMMPETPVTAYHFVKFFKENFYKGKIFHRVIPNFVAQGGDPRGDGFGGPGFLIRDEVSPIRHLPGTLGIATAGKDTGGCQFFFNTAPNLHLTGKYTLFAEITRGLDVAMALEMGDEIL